jgi:DNA invertase Pin-like site-specific DNA recombinase
MTERAALYARFSSDLQSDASIDDQLRLCRLRAEREGWIVVGAFSDKATSGALRKREGLDALLAELERGRVDIVLTESLDRLSRDLEHVASLYKRITFHGAQIITLSEGMVTDMHVGLRGTMASLYLKDLAAKTHRGLEGRIRQGRATGNPPFGYRVVRQLGDQGEVERGLRRIEQAEAVVVRRIFELYASGISPVRIARLLNAEGIPGPNGGAWLEDTIRGRIGRQDGILRNPIYDGRLVWNRRQNLKNPVTGALVRRDNAPEDHVETTAEFLRIVPHDLWLRVAERLQANAASGDHGTTDQHRPGFWDRRRPRHLLSGKVICGNCGKPFTTLGKSYLRCLRARNGSCGNTTSLHRTRLERLVFRTMSERLMAPTLLATFVEALKQEHTLMSAEAQTAVAVINRARATLERRIANIVDALAEGERSPSLRNRLAELERQLAQLNQDQAAPAAPIAPMPADPATLYRSAIAELEAALADDTAPDLRERARTFIHRLEVRPSDAPGGPPHLTLEGNLPAMLSLAGIGPQPKAEAKDAIAFSRMIESSIMRDPGARPLAGLGRAQPSLSYPLGSLTVNRAPVIRPASSRRFSAAMVPRRASTIWRLIDRPRPECWPKRSPCGRSE